eukprot:1146568-Pelagomonas_calceolata.AAC.2
MELRIHSCQMSSVHWQSRGGMCGLRHAAVPSDRQGPREGGQQLRICACACAHTYTRAHTHTHTHAALTSHLEPEGWSLCV